jgi:FAD synthase
MLIEVILKDKGHRMNVSFGAYLQRLCRSVAFKDKDNDRMYSMEYLIGDDTEFGDTISRKDIRMNEAGEQVEETVTMNNRYEEQNQRIENDVSRELCDLQENPRVIAKGATKLDMKGRCSTPSL